MLLERISEPDIFPPDPPAPLTLRSIIARLSAPRLVVPAPPQPGRPAPLSIHAILRRHNPVPDALEGDSSALDRAGQKAWDPDACEPQPIPPFGVC